LERAVVGHNTVLTVKLRWLSKKVYVVLLEILIRRIQKTVQQAEKGFEALTEQ